MTYGIQKRIQEGEQPSPTKESRERKGSEMGSRIEEFEETRPCVSIILLWGGAELRIRRECGAGVEKRGLTD